VYCLIHRSLLGLPKPLRSLHGTCGRTRIQNTEINPRSENDETTWPRWIGDGTRGSYFLWLSGERGIIAAVRRFQPSVSSRSHFQGGRIIELNAAIVFRHSPFRFQEALAERGGRKRTLFNEQRPFGNLADAEPSRREKAASVFMCRRRICRSTIKAISLNRPPILENRDLRFPLSTCCLCLFDSGSPYCHPPYLNHCLYCFSLWGWPCGSCWLHYAGPAGA
jgi:hypothetical protein